MVFKAATSLDFQDDMIGSINLLLCGKKADNATKMPFSLRSPRQTAKNMSVSNEGNNSSKCNKWANR